MDIFKRLLPHLIITLILISVSVTIVEAAEHKFPNPLEGVDSFQGLIVAIINGIVIPIGATVAVLAIIYSGFLFVTAQGNDEKLKLAKYTFFGAIIGGLILLGAGAIAEAIKGTICAIGENIPGCPTT